MTTALRDDGLELTLQQRADYIPLEDLLAETSSDGDLFNKVHKELLNRALRTIVGPRGCGKTHMMRYAWLKCSKDVRLPFAVYVSFNRYFRLEPLLSSRATALNQFHSWVLARVALAAWEAATAWKLESKDIAAVFESLAFAPDGLKAFVGKVERNQPLETEYQVLADSLSIDRVQFVIDSLRELSGRRATVLLMDDAALTLTPDYLLEFLDIVRSMKSVSIAPKVSVYPGTTEVSPKFHQGQDAIPIPVWLCVEDPSYAAVMDAIAERRVPGYAKIPKDVRSMLRFAAFGVPRAKGSTCEARGIPRR